MPRHRFLQKDAQTKLEAAVKAVEARSATEIVVTVRPVSGRYGPPGLIVGVLAAYGGLAFMLYAKQVFGLWAILLNTAVLLLLGGALGWLGLALRPTLLGAGRVYQGVEQAALATFYRLGISKTRDRSGVLVYVSLRERHCTVVPDVGVQEAIAKEDWESAVKPLQTAVAMKSHRPDGVEALASAIAGLAPLLETALPRRADDTNELPDFAGADQEVSP